MQTKDETFIFKNYKNENSNRKWIGKTKCSFVCERVCISLDFYGNNLTKAGPWNDSADTCAPNFETACVSINFMVCGKKIDTVSLLNFSVVRLTSGGETSNVMAFIVESENECFFFFLNSSCTLSYLGKFLYLQFICCRQLSSSAQPTILLR